MDYFAALTAFVEAADGSNFSRAAERLGIKASTVSRYIKDLEQDLGIALFNRSTRMLHLTEGGETFLLHARKVLEDLEQAKAATSALNQHPRGLLKLTVPPAFCRQHVLPHLAAFRQRFPDISLELALEDSQVNLIHAGVDLAIRIGALADSTLQARKLADERLLICVSPGFAAQHSAPVGAEDLSYIPAILGSQACDEFTLVGADTTWPVSFGGTLRINDLEARLLAAKAGLGMALLPDWLVARSLAEGTLQVWLPDCYGHYAERQSAVWFVYPPKRIVSSKVRSFIDFMVGQIGDPLAWKP